MFFPQIIKLKKNCIFKKIIKFNYRKCDRGDNSHEGTAYAGLAREYPLYPFMLQAATRTKYLLPLARPLISCSKCLMSSTVSSPASGMKSSKQLHSTVMNKHKKISLLRSSQFPRKQKTLKSPKNSANLYYIHKVPEMLTKMHLGARDDTSNAV